MVYLVSIVLLVAITITIAITTLGFSDYKKQRQDQIHVAEIEIRNIRQAEERKEITYKEFMLAQIAYAASRQKLMMANSRPRADFLFKIGITLLVLSLACPIFATIVYSYMDLSAINNLEKVSVLKQNNVELPKEFIASLGMGRDWHILAWGIAFGFLCLASAKGILDQQASEMKTYFEFGQKARYFERLLSMVELVLFEDSDKPAQKKAALQLILERFLVDKPDIKEEERTNGVEAASLGRFLYEAYKATQGGKDNPA